MFGKDIFLKNLSSHQRIGLHVFIYQPRRPIRDHGSKDDSSFMVARSAADGHVQGANVQFVQLRNGLGCGCGTDLQPGNTGQIQRLTELDCRSALSFQVIQEIGHLMFKR